MIQLGSWHYPWVFIPSTEFLSLGTGRCPKGYVGLFGLSLRFFHTESCFCFWSSLSRQGTNFAIICFLFTYSLKMHYTYCVIGLMLCSSLILQCLFSWMSWHTFSTLSVGLSYDNLNVPTEVLPLFKPEYLLEVSILCMALSQKAFWATHRSENLFSQG